ncbi:MAG: TGS domain-containing protein [Thermoproteales archaeon]|nr:TGS domain-containing protein [Thermoproteales archaeon]
MPANLPPQAKAKWLKVMEARTKEEKLKALMEFLSAVPKHKGTEKLVMHVRRQIARLRRELELERARRRGGGGPSLFVEKEGDVQLVMLGFPNSGKSTLFTMLTGVEVARGEAPFETHRPQPGMFMWEGLEVQLVDTPSLVHSPSSARNSQIMALAYNADALALVVDATQGVTSQLSLLEDMLREKGITIREEEPRVVIERRRSGGVVVMGGHLRIDEVARLLRSYGIYHALVKVEGPATLDDVEAAILGATAYKPALVMVTKVEQRPEAIKEAAKAASGLEVVGVGLNTRPEEVKARIVSYLLDRLGLIRIYTRNPKTGEVSKKPLVVRRGARVEDVARRIHSRLSKEFRYALVWNERRLKFSPMRVGRDFELGDGDVVEIVA